MILFGRTAPTYLKLVSNIESQAGSEVEKIQKKKMQCFWLPVLFVL
jgi:hypothetical protein